MIYWIAKRPIMRIQRLIDDQRCRVLALKYKERYGFQRIYFYHIRKDAGTSLNYMFFALTGHEGKSVYHRLTDSRYRRIIIDDKIFVGWRKQLIEGGHYFYAFSHIPAHQLSLPKDTFTITIIRDPIRRILSHYRMLLQFRQSNRPPPKWMEIEEDWIGNSFEDFLANLPKKNLLNQLYMFSESYDIEEAFQNITNCSHFFFTEEFEQGVKELSNKLGLPLEPVHARKSWIDVKLKAHEVEYLKKLVIPELHLYAKLSEYKRARCQRSSIQPSISFKVS